MRHEYAEVVVSATLFEQLEVGCAVGLHLWRKAHPNGQRLTLRVLRSWQQRGWLSTFVQTLNHDYALLARFTSQDPRDAAHEVYAHLRRWANPFKGALESNAWRRAYLQESRQ